MNPLVPNFSWVVPGKLAGSGLPAARSPWYEESAFDAIYAEGVRLVLSLMEQPDDAELLRSVGLESVHFPIDDFGIPTDEVRFAALIDEMHRRIETGTPVLVHCYAGIGRTGMWIASYLARHHGRAPADAIRHLRALRPRSIETPEQQAWVVRMAEI